MKSLALALLTTLMAMAAQAESTYKMKVTGMHCGGCSVMIEKSCLKLPGVKSVEFKSVDMESQKGEALIVFADKPLTKQQIQAELDKGEGHYKVVALEPATP